VRAVELRDATAGDRPFLLDMLLEACNWTGAERVARDEIGAHPRLAGYLRGWPRTSDFGVVAVDDRGRAGAAWARRFSAGRPGYGFVAADVPELSMAVVADRRGRGVGGRLLQALITLARQRDERALSLSVEAGNPAARLYHATGFVVVGREETAVTMLVELGGDSTG
jgi:GNAT superfamily N-acetyltransferase